jgi:hypothetical protein
MTDAATFLDVSGRPAPEATTGAPCVVVAAVDGSPVGCGLPQGHRGPHAWSGLKDALTGSKAPDKAGSARTPEARAAAIRSAGGRSASLADLCGVVSLASGAPLLCALEPDHKGAHSFSKVKAA